jgi:hypothetical protein
VETQLDAVVSGILTQPDVAATTTGYGTCMARAGFAGANDPALLARQVAAGYPNPVPEGGTDAPSWVAAQAREKKAAAADVGCRLSGYRAALLALGPQLTQFSQVHASELASVKAQWAALVTKAAGGK